MHIIIFLKYFVILKTRIVVAYLRMHSEKLNTVQSSKTTAMFLAYVFFSLPVEKRVEKNQRRRRGSKKWPFESVSVSRGKRRDRAAPRRSSIGRQTRLSGSIHTAPPRFLLSHKSRFFAAAAAAAAAATVTLYHTLLLLLELFYPFSFYRFPDAAKRYAYRMIAGWPFLTTNTIIFHRGRFKRTLCILHNIRSI